MDLEGALAAALPGVARSASGPDRIAYARDLWPRHHLEVSAGRIAEHRPGLVVWPRDTAEVAAVVRFCAGEGIPIVPFGAGSGVCGGVLPDPRTVVLDLKRMERWRLVDRGASSVDDGWLTRGRPALPPPIPPVDVAGMAPPTLREAGAPSGPGVLDVEAGALGIRLEEDLQARGFTIGHFPSSILCSTAGGWVAARGAGQCSGRYGKIEDMVASIDAVVGRGEVVRFHRRVHGPDLTPLFIGSEGVLGVITSVRLRLHPAPAARTFGAFSFPTVEAGWTAMRDMFQAGLRPAVARLYDPFDSYIARRGSVRRARGDAPREKHGPSMPGAGGVALRSILRAPRLLNEAVNALGGRVFRGSTLVLIFEAPAPEGAADMDRARSLAARYGAEPLGEGPARHWLEHRYGVSYRQSPVFMSGAFGDTMEVAAPWSRLDALYRDVRAALGRHVFVMAHLSHAYPDGCSIYFTFAGSGATPADALSRYDATWRAALDAAIAAGGTLSHHHGVGRSKAPKLGAELGLGVDVVHALRAAFDPAGIMNPGNLLPRERPARRPVTPAPATPAVDRASQLVHARGEATLAEVERSLSAHGLTLALDASAPPAAETTVAAWIAGGSRGAPDPWLDPVDHLVAGFTARLASGAELEVRPAPRRAVGPDLYALFHGAGERAGTLTSAHLRGRMLPGARPMPTDIERDPPGEEAESTWISRALDAAREVC